MYINGQHFVVPDIYKCDGEKIIKQCAAALTAVRENNLLEAEAILQSIVLTRTHLALEYCVYELDLDMRQEGCAHECEAFFAAITVIELIEIAQKRITHKQRVQRITKINISDIRLSAMLGIIMDIPDSFSDFLEEQIKLNESPDPPKQIPPP